MVDIVARHGAHLPCALLSMLLSVPLLAACGVDKDPLDSATAGVSAGPSGGPSGGPGGDPSSDPSGDPSGDPGGPPTEGSSTTEGGTTTASGTSDTGGTGHGACDQYLACVGAVTPDALPGAEMTFGPDGTCWQSTPEVAEQCLDTCASSLVTLADLFPAEPACGGGGVDPTGTTGDPPGTTTDVDPSTTSTTNTTTTTDPGNCQDIPNQSDDSPCTDPSGCGCSSGKCFIVPALGGFCGECLVDADCQGGGCSIPNPIAGTGAECNMGLPGDGCQTDAVCSEPSHDLCAEVILVPGIINVSTCSQCLTNADCGAGLVCAPTFDIPHFTGKNDCVPPGSVPDDQGCLADGGASACASGHCGEASLMGLFQFGVCGECSSDNDCPPGAICSDPEVDLDSGALIGAECL